MIAGDTGPLRDVTVRTTAKLVVGPAVRLAEADLGLVDHFERHS